MPATPAARGKTPWAMIAGVVFLIACLSLMAYAGMMLLRPSSPADGGSTTADQAGTAAADTVLAGGGSGSMQLAAGTLPAYERLDRGTDLIALSRGVPLPVGVPDIVGLGLDAATVRLEESGLRVETRGRKAHATIPKGDVVEQAPAAKSEVESGSTVYVSLSAGALVEVPDAVNKGYEQAKSAIEAAGLVASLKDKAYDSNIPAGRVRSQWPPAGDSVAPGATVYVVKSIGPKPRPRRSSASRGRRTSVCSGNCSSSGCHTSR